MVSGNVRGGSFFYKGKKIGVLIFQFPIDYNGNPVLSAYAPLNFEGLRWALLAEIDASEVFAAVKSLRWAALVVAALGLTAIMVGSFKV